MTHSKYKYGVWRKGHRQVGDNDFPDGTLVIAYEFLKRDKLFSSLYQMTGYSWWKPCGDSVEVIPGQFAPCWVPISCPSIDFPVAHNSQSS